MHLQILSTTRLNILKFSIINIEIHHSGFFYFADFFWFKSFLLILQTHTGMEINTTPKTLGYTEHYLQLSSDYFADFEQTSNCILILT